ncbi:MAG: sirohydrochlorin nickelochelatase [Methanobacterium sp.]|nr:sirohydrochlorin nickelochelatase [Methanobacterium sp.]
MEKNSHSDESIGILLIGHGSSLSSGNKVIFELAEKYKEKSDYPVEVGFMNVEKPTIPSAINMLAKKGVTKIIAMPVFLAHGLHTKQDIPYMMGLGNGREGAHYLHMKQEEIEFDGEIVYIEPLGADPRIADIIGDRVDDALE